VTGQISDASIDCNIKI
jgi:hypothetical protein